MGTVQLPISRREVSLRQPTGSDDLLLLEAPALDTNLALALVSRLASWADGGAEEWDALCVTDLDALLLLLRQMIVGDLLRTDVVCSASGCGQRFDVAFRIGDYLAQHQPRKARGVEPAEEPGWFHCCGTPVFFRLPRGADQIKIVRQPRPERELIRLCVRPDTISARMLKRIESAMETLAPSLSQKLQGECPECGAEVAMYFDAQQFVLLELRDQAAFFYEDVHLLARQYHWSQAEILALPRSRRARYAEMARQERSLA